MSTSNDDFERGAAMIQEVYSGIVPDIPKGTMAFNDVMTETIFAKVWTRENLSIRDRRLLLLGVIAAQGQTETWSIQARAALKRKELTPDELREVLIMLAPYAGYPNVAPLILKAEEAINESANES